MHSLRQADMGGARSTDAKPALDLLFTLDGLSYILKGFKISQAVELILRRKAGANPILCSETVSCAHR
jgi:hypothetical protein